jgi:osmotically-inducible protein OsmY
VFARKDGELEKAIRHFLDVSMYATPEADIGVAVHDGVVRLEGTVLYESDVRVAGSLVAKLDGVVGVENALHYRFRDPRRVSAVTL